MSFKFQVSTASICFTILFLAVAMVAVGHLYITQKVRWLPGESFSGIPGQQLSSLKHALQSHLETLAGDIGERSLYQPQGMRAAERYIEEQFAAYGLTANTHNYKVDAGLIQRTTDRLRAGHGNWLHGQLPAYPDELGDAQLKNIWVEIPGTHSPERLLVVGAHFDTVANTAGANDNATGVAALLELARALVTEAPRVSVILVALSAEELPIGGVQGASGSSVFLDYLLEQNKTPFGMISLETMGYYSEDAGSQHYPAPLDRYYPDRGNFIAFVSDSTSRDFVRDIGGLFRQHAEIASQGATLPSNLVPDVLRSDHETYVLRGIPGLMVTDTANFRYPHYHQPSDTLDKIDIEKLARVVHGLIAAVKAHQ
jgi:hypothetical protein